MPSSCVKIHTEHQSRHIGHHTLIMHLLTLPVSMRACSWIILRLDTLSGDHAFTHTSGKSLVMQRTTGHKTRSHTEVIWLSGWNDWKSYDCHMTLWV